MFQLSNKLSQDFNELIVRIDSNGILLPAFKGKTIDYKSIPRVTNINNKKDIDINNNKNKTNSKFSISSNVNLKDILISNSSSRKVVKE